jgi:hypothetical protein
MRAHEAGLTEDESRELSAAIADNFAGKAITRSCARAKIDWFNVRLQDGTRCVGAYRWDDEEFLRLRVVRPRIARDGYELWLWSDGRSFRRSVLPRVRSDAGASRKAREAYAAGGWWMVEAIWTDDRTRAGSASPVRVAGGCFGGEAAGE